MLVLLAPGLDALVTIKFGQPGRTGETKTITTTAAETLPPCGRCWGSQDGVVGVGIQHGAGLVGVQHADTEHEDGRRRRAQVNVSRRVPDRGFPKTGL